MEELISAAIAAQGNAYCPFSQYPVGAAIRTTDGQIFVGCNVENASFGATICAERVAVGTMIAAGHREIQAVAVATKDGGTPCGVCRQVLAEFSIEDAIVVCVAEKGEVKRLNLKELLPHAFTSKSLES